MNGKSKCKILKDIRRQIARDNDIAYVTSECKFQGECSGTCPKCEGELRYLEEELKKRQKAGKAIAVAGIAAALVVGASGCGWKAPAEVEPLVGDVPYVEQTEESPTEVILMGDVPAVQEEIDLAGGVPTESTVEPITGDVAYEE